MELELPAADAVAVASRRTPAAVAVVSDDGTSVTYAELDDMVSHDPVGVGVRPGEVVPVSAALDLGTIVSLWAVWRAGGVALPHDPAFPGLDPVRASWQTRPPGSTAAEVERQHTWVMTSGSSGTPRPVILTIDNVDAAVAASAERLGNGPGDRWLLTLPLFHVGGLSILWRSAGAGGAVAVHARFDAHRAAAAFATGEVSYASLVPTMLHRIVELGMPPSSALIGILIGGAQAPAGLIAAAHGLGYPVLPTYGMTETCSQAATAVPGEVVPPDGTVGPPLVDFDITFAARGGIDGEPGEGEILVDGPAVSPGYAFEAPRSGAFPTGDLGHLDDEGRLVVVGRIDDLIVSGGENVVPVTVERAIASHPDVTECLVFGLPDAEWGEVVVAVVMGRPGTATGAVTETQLLDHVRRRLRSAEIPRRWHIVDDLPELPNGKIDRRRIVARYGGSRR